MTWMHEKIRPGWDHPYDIEYANNNVLLLDDVDNLHLVSYLLPAPDAGQRGRRRDASAEPPRHRFRPRLGISHCQPLHLCFQGPHVQEIPQRANSKVSLCI